MTVPSVRLQRFTKIRSTLPCDSNLTKTSKNFRLSQRFLNLVLKFIIVECKCFTTKSESRFVKCP